MDKDRKEQWAEPKVEELDIAEQTEFDPFQDADGGTLGLDPGGGS